MCTDTALNSILERIVKAYQDVYSDSLDKIYLYGSYSRGTHDEYSDIDIAAIVYGKRDELEHQLENIWDVSSDLELDYEVIVSPTVIPYDEFHKYKKHLPYYKNIEKEGKEISGQYESALN